MSSRPSRRRGSRRQLDRLGIVLSAWSVDGDKPGLFRLDPDGSNVETLYLVEQAELRESLRWASALPDGKGILFTRFHAGDYGRSTIEVFSIEDRTTRVLARGLMGSYAATGHVLFTRDGKLFALPFDEAALEAKGLPQVVMEGLPIDGISGESTYAVSRAGDLAYLSASDSARERANLLWVETDGSSTPLSAPGRQYSDPRISPDGSKFAFSIPSEGNEIWVHDVEGDRSPFSAH